MITKEMLEDQIEQLKRDEAELLGQANMARGAILQCEDFLARIQEMTEPPQQEALPLKDLAKQMNVTMEEPKVYK